MVATVNLLKMTEIQPKKSLGQHWLNDDASLNYICSVAQLSPEDYVLEIGAGQGALTNHLIKRAKTVLSLEIDPSLVVLLERSIKSANLKIINQDILSFNLTELPSSYKIVANIPYYLTSKLIRILSESTNPPSLVVILVQKEVAERVAAEPGQMSLLSVTAQFYWQVELGRVIPAKLFQPAPKIDSQVLILKPRQQLALAQNQLSPFFRLVRAGFAARRKTLLNSLSAGLRLNKDIVSALLTESHIDPNIRPQQLSIDDWVRLFGNNQKIEASD